MPRVLLYLICYATALVSSDHNERHLPLEREIGRYVERLRRLRTAIITEQCRAKRYQGMPHCQDRAWALVQERMEAGLQAADRPISRPVLAPAAMPA